MTTRKQRQHHASSRKIDHKSKQKKGLPAVAKDPPKRNKDSEEQDKIVSSSTSAPTSAAQSFHGSRPVPPQVKDKKAGLQGAARNKHHAMKSKVMKKPTNNRKDREHEDSDSDVGELEKYVKEKNWNIELVMPTKEQMLLLFCGNEKLLDELQDMN